MRRLKVIGLCLGAMLAIAAIGASSASALPEWGQCYAKAGGKYTESNCQTKSKVVKGVSNGAYEWRKGTEITNANKTFEGVGGHGVLTTNEHECTGGYWEFTEEPLVEGPKFGKRLPYSPTPCSIVEDKKGEKQEEVEEAGTIIIECTAEHATGELSGANAVKNVEVRFTHCTVLGPEGPACTSPGAAEGEVKTETLKGVLGYINKAKKEVGVELNPSKPKGVFATFTCAGILRTAVGAGNAKEGSYYKPETTGGRDGILSPVTPVNVMTPTVTQVYTVECHGQETPAGTCENLPRSFEGKPIGELEDYIENLENKASTKWSPAGEEITNVNKQAGGAEIEIKA